MIIDPMAVRLRKAVFNDPSRFEGNGISFKAKLIGIEDVKEARGDLMCQEALIKLKNSVKISGEHKRKIFVNVTLEGLKIIDAISLIVLHAHAVHRISFIARDTTDTRAFGYVYGTEDGLHKFFAIKTAAAAENLVLTLRDLFQVVYEMKKKEMEAAKEKLAKGETPAAEEQKENSQTSGPGSTSGIGQTPAQKVNADAENIYQVPTNNAPVNPDARAEEMANLFDLEDQAEHILKGIEQIKNLEFDSLASDSPSGAASSRTNLGPSARNGDAWGFSATPSPAATSALGDLTGLQTGSFPAVGQQLFAAPTFPVQGIIGGSPGFNPIGGGLPVTSDPFAGDPFSSPVQQPRTPAPGFGVVNPFVSGFSQPYGIQGVPQRMNVMGVRGMVPGMAPHGMMSAAIMGGVVGPYGVQMSPGFPGGNAFAEEPNILQPLKKDSGPDLNAVQEPVKPATKSRQDLFGDLLDIKKSVPSSALPPKDLFAQVNASEKKPMNEMKGPGRPMTSAAQNKQASGDGDPFGDSDLVILDKTRGLLLSDSGEEDPFDTSYIPHSFAEPSEHIIKSSFTVPPPVPSRHPPLKNNRGDVSSFSSMPSSSPPPPPRLSLHPIPPLPCRNIESEVKSQIIKDVNDNVSSPVGDDNFADFSNTSCMLPSPVETPPPLPAHIAFNSLSHTPPLHGMSHSNVHCSWPISHEEISKNSAAVSLNSRAISLNSNVNNTSSHAHNLNTHFNDAFTPEDSNSAHDRLSNLTAENHFSVESTQFKDSHCVNSFSDFHNDKSASLVHKANESNWVSFGNSDDLLRNTSDFFSSSLSTNDADDPFNVPLHLTPGFKAVAKFGNDPFDDCGVPDNDGWDPFTSGDSSVNSPFGDAFATPTQQVGGKSFFD